MDITPKLLEKYAKGNCSQAEIEAVEHWLGCNDNGFEHVENDTCNKSSYLEEKLWSNIKTATLDVSETIKEKTFRLPKWSIAASVTICIGLSSYLMFSDHAIIYNTNAGEVKSVQLKDGTKVTLNAVSSLRISKRFGERTREVTLNGEAYFEVEKDSLHPFIVKTDRATTKVLGTKFNFSAYERDTTMVTLDEGKVVVYDNKKGSGRNIIMNPHQRVALYGDTLVKKNIRESHHTEWIYKKFVFNNESFARVIKKLERFYGCTIEVKKQSLYNKKYNGSHSDQTIGQLLDDIGFVLDFKFEKTNQKITLY